MGSRQIVNGRVAAEGIEPAGRLPELRVCPVPGEVRRVRVRDGRGGLAALFHEEHARRASRRILHETQLAFDARDADLNYSAIAHRFNRPLTRDGEGGLRAQLPRQHRVETADLFHGAVGLALDLRFHAVFARSMDEHKQRIGSGTARKKQARARIVTLISAEIGLSRRDACGEQE